MIPEESIPPVVGAYQLVLILLGLTALTHCVVHRAFRMQRKAAPVWRIAPTDFGVFLVVLVSATFFVQVFAGFLFMEENNAAEGLSPVDILVFGTLSSVTWIAVWFAFRRNMPKTFGEPMSSVGLSWREAALPAMYSFLVALPVIGLIGLLWQGLLQVFAPSDALEPQDVVMAFGDIDSLLVYLGLIGVVVILAPISEELIFRGCFYRFLKGVMPLPAAVGVNAVLFSALHMNLMNFVALAILGAVLCLVYEKTGSLKVPILLHAVFNLNTVLMLGLMQIADG